jgi:hypothetical protein
MNSDRRSKHFGIIDVKNIVDQLRSEGKSWKASMQSLSLCATKLDTTCGNQLYERKHNPFVSYKDIQTNPARMARITKILLTHARETVAVATVSLACVSTYFRVGYETKIDFVSLNSSTAPAPSSRCPFPLAFMPPKGM